MIVATMSIALLNSSSPNDNNAAEAQKKPPKPPNPNLCQNNPDHPKCRPGQCTPPTSCPTGQIGSCEDITCPIGRDCPGRCVDEGPFVCPPPLNCPPGQESQCICDADGGNCRVQCVDLPPCGPDQVRNPDGVCECRDPNKELNADGQCVDRPPGQCTPPTNCPVGQVGTCEDITCPPGQDCTGTCKAQCPTGQIACGSNPAVCTAQDDKHCGPSCIACADNQACNNGRCEDICPTGQTLCRQPGTILEICVAEATRDANGNCQCTDPNKELVDGQCVPKCSADQTRDPTTKQCTCTDSTKTLCNGQCVDTQTDISNCGSCGNACSNVGESCNGGTCQCPTGLTGCNGQCVDLKTDGNNCGTCSNSCSDTQECNNGICGCPVGQNAGACGSCYNLDEGTCPKTSSCEQLTFCEPSPGFKTCCGAGSTCVQGFGCVTR